MSAATGVLAPTPAHGPTPTPEAILALGSAYWGSRTLLAAAELGLFTELATAGALDAEALRERLNLHPRGARAFFDALVALGLLKLRDGRYANTSAADAFLDRAKPGYVGGLLEMGSRRSYAVWGSLTDALRTGEPQNGTGDADDPFAALYADPGRLSGFLRAMSGVSAGAAHALAHALPWERHRTVAHGFGDVTVRPLVGPLSIAIATKGPGRQFA